MTAPDYGDRRRSIPTIYNGRLFRSKLEADWARSFDARGIAWEYEREGHYFGNVFYLPDFWLPQSRQFVEVKAVFEPNDCRKINALLAHVDPRPHTDEDTPDFPIIACLPDGVFYGWRRTKNPVENFYRFLTESARAVDLYHCARCGGWWFADPDSGWNCQCCGASDGNGHLVGSTASPLGSFGNEHL